MSSKPHRSHVLTLGIAAMMAFAPWQADAQSSPQPPPAQPQDPAVKDFKTIASIAHDAAVSAIKSWIANSKIVDGKVVPPAAIVPPGGLTSSVSVTNQMRKYMIDKGVSEPVATSFATPIGAAVTAWAKGYATTAPVAFATLPLVPPGLNVQIDCMCAPPHLLRVGASVGEANMGAKSLTAALKASVKPSAADSKHIESLATTLAVRFQKWHLTATLGRLKAIPRPIVPGAPTIIWGLKGSAVLGGPAF